MKVLIHDRHTPHCFMVATSMPDVEFISIGWNGALRPEPANLKVILPPACFDFDYDAVLEDDFDAPAFKAKAKRKIWIQHNEWNGADPMPKMLDAADACIVVSDHKRATMREYGLSPKVHTVGFGFDLKQWEAPEPKERVGAGTACNSTNEIGEVRAFVELLDCYVPMTVIGWNNSRTQVTRKIEPYGFDAYKAALSQLDVFIYAVIGEQMGMAPYEAAMMGIPVVTASQPEAWNWMFDTWNGRITREPPISSARWLAERAHEIAVMPEERKRLGENGRNTVAARFPLSKIGEDYKGVLFG